jgi:hypothetical protein
MGEEERAIRLQQLANIVIDAYLGQEQRFRPSFGEFIGVMYMERPKGDDVPADLQVGYWYEKADFEPEGQK